MFMGLFWNVSEIHETQDQRRRGLNKKTDATDHATETGECPSKMSLSRDV